MRLAFVIALACRQASGEVSAEVRDRMSWWKGADQPAPPAIQPTNDRYLIFDYDAGGLNNIRIGWEMAAIAAVESDRTLVYPPAQNLYLLGGGPSGFEYFLNMDRVHSGLAAISIKDFIKREQKNYPMPEALIQYAQTGSDTDFPWAEWTSFRATNMDSAGSDDVELCNINTYKTESKAIWTAPPARIFGCGNWPNVGEPKFHTEGYAPWNAPDSVFAMLRNHFMWHPDVFEIAGHVVENLGLFNYVSMHARYGDFQFKSGKRPGSTMLQPGGWLGTDAGASLAQVAFERESERRNDGFLKNTDQEYFSDSVGLSMMRGQRALSIVRTWLDADKTRPIYISTDERSKEYLEPFKAENLNVVRWQELVEDAEQGKGPLAAMFQKFSRGRIDNLSGPIEQLICTFGRIFVGSEKSTFTGYIERMRLYAQAPTHATFIKYAGISASDKGLRMFHDDLVDKDREAQVAKEIQDWESVGGVHKLNRDDVGALPRDAA